VGLVQVGDGLAGAFQVVELAALGRVADLPFDPALEADPGWLALGHGAMLPFCARGRRGRFRAPSGSAQV
jgi:hypothetical protein